MTEPTNPWDDFGLRDVPPMSARTRQVNVPPRFGQLLDEARRAAGEPLLGVTEDGSVRTDLFSLGGSVSTGRILDAALRFQELLRPEQRNRLVLEIDAPDKRLWFNIHPNVFRHGLLLEDLGPEQRSAALGVMEATLSDRGFQQARDIMRLNGLLADLTGRPDDFGEWPYWVSFFGAPSVDEPWAWQIDGHHLNLNFLVLPDQIVMTPSFMGSEPCHVVAGPLAGTQVLVTEERTGLNLIRSLDAAQLETAVLAPSIEPGQLPPELEHPIDGRMMAGAFKDNLVVGRQGLSGQSMTQAQRRLMTDVVAAYVGWADDGHAGVKMDEVIAHLDETSFCWLGARDDDGPFYYRVHSPVVLIEFDHHPGIVFDNLVPSRNHIHSILRTPNGGDYGADLLRQHYERVDHADGQHHHHDRLQP